MKEIVAEIHVSTGLPPCCLQIFQGKWILVGTYELDKTSGFRTGSIEIYNEQLRLINTIKTYGAILDLKLSPFDDSLVATAHSTGNIMLWKVQKDDNDISVKELHNIQILDTDDLITSLHFSPTLTNIILVTSTSGEALTIDLERDKNIFSANTVSITRNEASLDRYTVQGQEVKVTDFRAEKTHKFSFQHSLECWTGDFGKLTPLENVVFTGGDDSTIAAHDLRSGDNIWSNSRVHDAGVVAIKTSSQTFRVTKPTSLITGSYDDNIRSFDLRMFGADSIYPGTNIPVVNGWAENLGGGVWRLAEAPNNDSISNNRLMVCCMYNGAKVVNVEDDQFVVEDFIKDGHESMCYGGDWGNDFIASCSFYDNSLQLWKSSSMK